MLTVQDLIDAADFCGASPVDVQIAIMPQIYFNHHGEEDGDVVLVHSNRNAITISMKPQRSRKP